MTPGHVALVSQLAATLFMTGLIWFVQIVHYPLFAKVPPAAFPRYQQQNLVRTTPVVLPPMIVELAAGLALLVWRPPLVPRWTAIAGAVLLGVIWLSTALVQAPAHGRIAAAFDARTHRAIVATNWVRTVAWSARAVLAISMLLAAFPPE
jgi:hypothetical protein